MKNKYEKPEMKIIEITKESELLCGSNTYWCDEQPSPEEWWKKED